MPNFHCTNIFKSARNLVFALQAFALLTFQAGCTSVFFQPQNIQYLTPDKIGLEYEEVNFRSSDGTELFGWFLPAQGVAKGTVLFLHGNAENISTHIGSVYWLPAQHYNVFLPDYRGYGGSQGSPSLAGLRDDINSAMAYLLRRTDIDTTRIVVLAQSLGGALGIYTVAESPYRNNIRALIAESAFADFRRIVCEKLDSFWLTWPLQWPLSLTIDNDFSPLPVVHRISPIPLLIIHGEHDNVVPLSHGQSLFAAAAEPKEIWELPAIGHIAALKHAEYRTRLLDYLTRVMPPN
jgi:uncharacterized protein